MFYARTCFEEPHSIWIGMYSNNSQVLQSFLMPLLDGSCLEIAAHSKLLQLKNVSYQICGFMYILTVKFSGHG